MIEKFDDKKPLPIPIAPIVANVPLESAKKLDQVAKVWAG